MYDSESPRLPSPWEAHLASSLFSNSHLRVASDHGSPGQASPTLRCLIPEEDLQGHIEYKLRLPPTPSTDRLERLTSQLKWRLLEGGGKAIYELGVCDNGLLLGIDDTELETSLRTLQRMAASLGARVSIVRKIEVCAGGGVALNALRQSMSATPDGLRSQASPLERTVEAKVQDSPRQLRTTKQQRRQARYELYERTSSQIMEKPVGDPTVFEIDEEMAFLGFDGDSDDMAKLSFSSRQIRKPSKSERRFGLSSRAPRRESVDMFGDESEDEMPELSPSSSPSPPATAPTPDSPAATPVLNISLDSGSGFTLSSTGNEYVASSYASSVSLGFLDPAEEEKQRTRRLQRKQWKMERKAVQHAAVEAEARLNSLSGTDGGLYGSLEDEYMDGLVGMFDGVRLNDVEVVRPATRRKKKKTWNGKGVYTVPTCERILHESLSGSAAASPSPEPVEAPAAHEKVTALVSGGNKGGTRYAMECLVSYGSGGKGEEHESDGNLDRHSDEDEFGDMDGFS